MTRTPSRSKNTRPTPKASTERRRAQRGDLKLLTAFRCLDVGKESLTGFARTLNLSSGGALLESPDEFEIGQNLSLEFLMDDNRIAQANGRVMRKARHGRFHHVAITFVKASVKTRRLIDLQISS
jgi:hypothetical protein